MCSSKQVSINVSLLTLIRGRGTCSIPWKILRINPFCPIFNWNYRTAIPHPKAYAAEKHQFFLEMQMAEYYHELHHHESIFIDVEISLEWCKALRLNANYGGLDWKIMTFLRVFFKYKKIKAISKVQNCWRFLWNLNQDSEMNFIQFRYFNYFCFVFFLQLTTRTGKQARRRERKTQKNCSFFLIKLLLKILQWTDDSRIIRVFSVYPCGPICWILCFMVIWAALQSSPLILHQHQVFWNTPLFIYFIVLYVYLLLFFPTW